MPAWGPAYASGVITEGLFADQKYGGKALAGLKTVGYNETISVEAASVDFPQYGRETLAMLRFMDQKTEAS